MARLNADTANSTTRSRITRESSGHTVESSPDPTSSAAGGSDKENSVVGTSRKRKSGTIMSVQGESSADASKRRRLQTEGSSSRSRGALQEELNNRVDRNYYDPDQDVEQVRSSRKRYRDLISRVNDSRSEYLQASSKGIENTLNEADELYGNVKQTSVATIDSRLLVSVGDLAHRKVKTLTLGDSTIGIDVDDFITKCISFMKKGDEQDQPDISATQSSQRQRRRRRTQAADNDDDEDDDNPMNWSYLGNNACFLYNSRPSLSGFLLGPLSVQKKARQATQRRAKQTQTNPTQTARPVELGDEELEKQESANLTVICSEIARLLDRTISEKQEKITEEYDRLPNPTDEEINTIITTHGLTDNGCMPLFNFCVNPRSFGQTVENMFYVSFLIKEGKFGLDFDRHGLPTLGMAEQKSVAERQETSRNQAVFTLDFDVWRDLVESFGISESVIPHRPDEDWDDGTVVNLPFVRSGDEEEEDT